MKENKLLQAALRYAELGYPVLPCGNDKTPLTKTGFKEATTDPNQIREWWRKSPKAYIGIAAAGLVVIDRDILDTGAKNPWPRDRTYTCDLFDGPTSRTPRGGQHHFFRRPHGVKWRCSQSKLATKVDVRTDGGYIIAPPSMRSDGRYEWVPGQALDIPPSELPLPPEWLADALNAIHPPASKVKSEPSAVPPPMADGVHSADLIARAERYIDRMPEAVSGQGGHNKTYAVACTLVNGFGLDAETAYGIMARRYNPRCRPEWSEQELRHKVSDAASKEHERPRGYLRNKQPPTRSVGGRSWNERLATGLCIDCKPADRGTKAVVSARVDDHAVMVEHFDLAKSREREKFIGALRVRLGSAADRLLDAAEVERVLATSAADLVAPPAAMPPPEVVEIGDGQVVRPERFILPTVSGVVVPRRVAMGGQPVSEWMLYLRWNDGRRESMRLPELLDLGSEQVFITPTPPPPPPGMAPGWSASSRAAWLDGNPGMPPDEVCMLLLKSIAKYLDLPRETARGTVVLLATYTLLTYMPSAFDAVPYLAVSGPAGSGKTRVLELLQEMAFRPKMTCSTSEAAIFRTLDAFGGTALLDEAERLHAPTMEGLLQNMNAGYKRATGHASRCEVSSDGQVSLRSFNVFGPKVFAGIRELPLTLASRSISIPMFRSPPGSLKPLLRLSKDSERWRIIRDALHVLAMEHGSEWLDLPRRTDVVPPMTTGRNYELWQPLLSIAAWLDDHGARDMLDLLQRHAAMCMEASRETATPPDDEVLLHALAEAIASGAKPTLGELLKTVTDTEPSLFRNWSARAVSSHIARYGLKTKRRNGRRVLAVTTSELLRVQTAYGLDLGLTPSLPPETCPNVPLPPRQTASQGT